MSEKTGALSAAQLTFLEIYLGVSTHQIPPRASGASLVQLQKMRLAYVETRKAARVELQSLEAAINAIFVGDEQANEVAHAAKRIYDGLSAFDDELVDVLDTALNSSDTSVRAKLEGQAAKHIKRYLSAVETDPVMRFLDANPIRPVSVQEKLRKTLGALAARLGA